MKRSIGIGILVVSSAVAMLIVLGPPTPESIKWILMVRFPRVSWVDANTLGSWMDDDAGTTLRLLDARTEKEYAVSHLRHAIHVGSDGSKLSGVSIPDDATVVVYCSVGYRSATVVEQLRDRGVGPVYNLTGGIFGWANAGRPLYRNGERVYEVHPYGEAWRWLVREDLRAR